MSKPLWAYGVTTVPVRCGDHLLPTLDSLRLAGFHTPWLFVDGYASEKVRKVYTSQWPHVLFDPPIKAFGNWVMAAWQLLIRFPEADRYAIFQDDIVCCPNLRRYLDGCEYPTRGYWNLITYPPDAERNAGAKGWHLSVQKGHGAQGLVFDSETLRTLLAHRHLVDHPLDAHRGAEKIDGTIIECMRTLGYREFVHMPSLIGHVGENSQIRTGRQPNIEFDPTYDPLGDI